MAEDGRDLTWIAKDKLEKRRKLVLSGHYMYSILCGVRLHYTSFTVHV